MGVRSRYRCSALAASVVFSSIRAERTAALAPGYKKIQSAYLRAAESNKPVTKEKNIYIYRNQKSGRHAPKTLAGRELIPRVTDNRSPLILELQCRNGFTHRAHVGKKKKNDCPNVLRVHPSSPGIPYEYTVLKRLTVDKYYIVG